MQGAVELVGPGLELPHARDGRGLVELDEPGCEHRAGASPCFVLLLVDNELPDFLPALLRSSLELAVIAARSFVFHLLRSTPYCFSFFTISRLPGIGGLPLSFCCCGALLAATMRFR